MFRKPANQDLHKQVRAFYLSLGVGVINDLMIFGSVRRGYYFQSDYINVLSEVFFPCKVPS